MTRTVQLGEKTFTASPIPLGRLKKLIPAFNRCGIAFAGGAIDEAALEDLNLCLHHGLNIPLEELEFLPATLPQLIAALDTVAQVAGLKSNDEGASGNAEATGSSGTPSTPT